MATAPMANKREPALIASPCHLFLYQQHLFLLICIPFYNFIVCK